MFLKIIDKIIIDGWKFYIAFWCYSLEFQNKRRNILNVFKYMGANDIVKLSISKRKFTAIIINNGFIGLQGWRITALP